MTAKSPYIVLRHPDRYRRVMHRLHNDETVDETIALVSSYFDLKERVVLVDPFNGDVLRGNRVCPIGEYDLVYE